MNMKSALTSALHLFVVAALLTAGFLFLFLHYMPSEQNRIVSVLLERSCEIGFGLIISAIILASGFYLLDQGKSLRIKMGRHLTEVDPDLIRSTLDECFRLQFGKMISLLEIAIPNKTRLEIHVSITPLEEDAREELFVKAEKELQTVLGSRFGYYHPFYLVVRL